MYLSMKETTNPLAEARLSTLRNVWNEHDFEILKEERDIFTFIEAIKR